MIITNEKQKMKTDEMKLRLTQRQFFMAISALICLVIFLIIVTSRKLSIRFYLIVLFN